MHVLRGGCHCGNITIVYKTAMAPEETHPRACQCTFCRKHNTSAISDADGELTVTVGEGNKLSRYRFGLRTADFLVCRECGVYMGAFMPGADENTGFATLMSAVLDERARYPEGQAISYGGEEKEGRLARRRKVWTPTRLQVG